MKTTRVLKFGGSSFPTLAAYGDVAAYLESRLASDSERLVVVVSAMSGTTGRILEAALQVGPELSPEITDSVLGTGEIVAACLMRAALERRGVAADHVSGFQLGVVTDSKFTRAKPVSVDGAALAARLSRCRVLVAAGGQAVDDRGRMTMLGRNSSDLSAVILAAALRLPECEIFSDVPGVYSADPYAVPEAEPLAEVRYEDIVALSRGGAKVLHHGAVEHARDQGVRIVCRGTGSGRVGSVIGAGPAAAAVASNAKVAVLRFESAAGRDEARLKLESEGIVALAADRGDIPYLAVSRENRGFSQALAAAAGDAAEEPGWCLLTALSPKTGVSRRLVPERDAAAEVRRVHAELRPRAAAAAGPAPEKRRAAESGLLVG